MVSLFKPVVDVVVGLYPIPLICAFVAGAAVGAFLMNRRNQQRDQEIRNGFPIIMDDAQENGKQKLNLVDHYNSSPRQGYLSWEDYFMSIAFLSAMRSKDPNKQVGACIVSDKNIILGIGYNGFPRGCPDTVLPWAKKSKNDDILETKYPYVVHAEANALLNKNATSVEGAKIYVTMFPCNECAKLLIQAGIKEVIFYEDKQQQGSFSGADKNQQAWYQASKKLLKLANVKTKQHAKIRPIVLQHKLL